MTGQSARSSSRAVEQLVCSAWSAAGTIVLCLLILAATADLPYPTRELGAELRMLLLTYPVAHGLVLVLTRRLPTNTRALLTLVFMGAVVVRIAVLCGITPVMYMARPYYGSVGDDPFYYTVMTRVFANMITGNDYHLAVELRQSLPYLGLAIAHLVTRAYIPDFTMIFGAMVALAGYSVVAVAIPMVMISSLVPVIVFMVVRRVFSSRTAWCATFWTAYAANFIYFGLFPNKEPLTLLVVACTLLLCVRPLGDWSRKTTLGTLLLALLGVTTMRLELPFIVLCLVGFSRLYWRLSPRHRRQALWCCAVIPLLSRGNPIRELVGLTINIVSVPALSWCFTPMSAQDLERIFLVPTAVVWPLIAGFVVMAILSYGLGKLETSRLILVCSLSILGLLSTHDVGAMNAARHRLCIEWMLVVYALSGVEALRDWPPQIRAKLVHWAFSVSAGLVVLHLLYALVKT